MKFLHKLTLCLMIALPWHVATAHALTEIAAPGVATEPALLKMATLVVNTAMTDPFPLVQMCGAFVVYFGIIYLCATVLSTVRAKRRQRRVLKAGL
jgi:hypothetical protein